MTSGESKRPDSASLVPMPVFPQSDYEREKDIAAKAPLTLDFAEFKLVDKKEEVGRIGGTSGDALRQGVRIDSSGQVAEICWLRKVSDDEHYADEYFAHEILRSVFQIQTPRVHSLSNIALVIDHVEGYVPVLPLLYDVAKIEDSSPELKAAVEQNPEFKKLHAKYRLDLSRQVVVDKIENVEYKISGNFFGSDLAATLICDPDFQPGGNNFGFVFRGQRVFATAIDKDRAVFQGDSYNDLVERVKHIINDPIYSFATLDQKLFSVNSLANALDKNYFDPIFNNDCVLNTPGFAECSERNFANVKVSAQSILAHHPLADLRSLIEFRRREVIRNDLADKIILLLNFPADPSYLARLKNFIVEDLRGRYFEHLFLDQHKKQISPADLNNKVLLNAAVYSYIQEWYPAAVISGLEMLFLQAKFEYQNNTETPLSPRGASMPLSPSKKSGLFSPKRVSNFAKIEEFIKLMKEEKDVQQAKNILIGAIIHERNDAQKTHETQLIKRKPISHFSQLMDDILKAIGYDHPAKKALALAAYNDFKKPPARPCVT